MSEEEYQQRIDRDPTVRRLSEKTVREKEKQGLSPEERNPRGAGRKRNPSDAPLPSVTMRVPGELAESVRRIIKTYRKDCNFTARQLKEMACELEYYTEKA